MPHNEEEILKKNVIYAIKRYTMEPEGGKRKVVVAYTDVSNGETVFVAQCQIMLSDRLPPVALTVHLSDTSIQEAMEKFEEEVKTAMEETVEHIKNENSDLLVPDKKIVTPPGIGG